MRSSWDQNIHLTRNQWLNNANVLNAGVSSAAIDANVRAVEDPVWSVIWLRGPAASIFAQSREAIEEEIWKAVGRAAGS